MGVTLHEDWDAVAVAITQRLADLRITQQDLAARARVSPVTVRELQRNAAPRKRQARTLAVISEALEWPSGYLEAKLMGKPLPSSNDPVMDELAEMREQLAVLRKRLDELEAPS